MVSPADNRLRFGIQTATMHTTWKDILGLWKEADAGEFDTAWLFDHLMPISGSPDGPCLDSWTLLSALALETRNLNIGILVCSNTFRHPVLLAKMATTVDILSGGRLLLGLGAGFYPVEHEAYGIPLPPVKDRMGQLEEALQVVNSLWTQDRVSFAGRYYQLKEAVFNPKPVQKPKPPIIVGGSGEKRLIPIAARYADGWNLTGTHGLPEIVRHKVRVFEESCVASGRNPEEMDKSLATFLYLSHEPAQFLPTIERWGRSRGLSLEEAKERVLLGTPDMVRQRIEELQSCGLNHFILQLVPPFQLDSLRLFRDEVLPQFRTA